MTKEFEEHFGYMLSTYSSSPFNSNDYYNLNYLDWNLGVKKIVSLNISYLNFYITKQKFEFKKDSLRELINQWLDVNNKPNFSEQGKVLIETWLLFLLGDYVRNEFILRDASKLLSRSFVKEKSKRKKVNYELIRAIKNLPYLRKMPDNNKQLELEYYHLLHGNKGLSIRTVFIEEITVDGIKATTTPHFSNTKVFDLLISCYFSVNFVKKIYSPKTIEKRIERLSSSSNKKKINRIKELEKILF